MEAKTDIILTSIQSKDSFILFDDRARLEIYRLELGKPEKNQGVIEKILHKIITFNKNARFFLLYSAKLLSLIPTIV